ncbi:MAG: sporulation transcription factor Spo0A, partial [Clostridia bacterium]
NYFSNNEDVIVVATANDGIKGIEAILKAEPDVVLLDMVMPQLDGIGVLLKLNNIKFEFRPKVIVVSQLLGENFVAKAIQYGACYYLSKSIAFEVIKDRVIDVQKSLSNNLEIVGKDNRHKEKGVDEKISNIFMSVGIPAHIKGYQFLREAIKMAINTPEIINSITKKLYPSIAEQFDTSASKVERAIRHAIEVAWNRGKIENINNLFGVKIYSSNEKPTNGEFIALVADKMLIEGA